MATNQMADSERCENCGQQIKDQSTMRRMDGKAFCSDNCAQQYQRQHQH